MKRVPLLLFLFAMCLALSPPASAGLITLTVANSTALIDPESPAGMYNWTVEGTNFLNHQWFWYRVGSDPERSIDSLGAPTVTTTSNTARLVYGGASAGFTIDILYSLVGGPVGSHIADIGEQIVVTNVGTSNLDFHFFQYSDFDLSQSPGSDVVVIDGSKRFVNQGGVPGLGISETTATPPPNRVEAANYADTLAKLLDADADNLNNNFSIVTPGDVTWAFQWDRTIGPSGTLIISKDKWVQTVPEPAAIALLGGVFVLVASKLRKRPA